MSLRILIAAGGTGGHVLPAMTVARVLKARLPDVSCVAVSGERGVATTLWDRSLGDLATIPVRPWPRPRELMDPRYWWRQGRATAQLVRLLARYKPQVVVGFGGYVAGPTVLLAKLTGSRTVIHEQNVFPGRTTRMLASWADRVAVSFEETRQHLPARTSVTVTGNPVRLGIERSSGEPTLNLLGLAPRKPVLLVMGGSQGSRTINAVCVEAMALLPPRQRRTFQLLHLTGTQDLPWVMERYRALGVEGRATAYLEDMGAAYAAATLVVARAGATTLAELVATATPSVLVPYPYARAHQAANAQWLSSRGGALVVDQQALSPEHVAHRIVPLLTDAVQLDRMRQAMRGLSVPGAADRLADTVLEMAHAD